jgi:predicted RNA binding protein YcfA (HicA-like mRNA interferase family)
MPKLRRLNGREVTAIFESFGFKVIRISGNHHRLRRTIEVGN